MQEFDQGQDLIPARDANMPAVRPAAPIDVQLASARTYPRDDLAVIEKITKLATIDEEAAAECLYALVRKKKNKKRNSEDTAEENKAIEGPSIRLAEIAAQKYGNCRIEARVVEVNKAEKYVEAEGIFLDLETNMASKATVRRRISTSGGYLFSDDMIIVTGNAACAIAKRNAILAGIPRSVYRPAYQAARKLIAGSVETLPKRREEAVKAFSVYGVKQEQLLEHFDVESLNDITADHLVTLRGMFNSLRSQEATVEEMFAPDRRPVDKDYDPLGEAAKRTAVSGPAGDKAEENNPRDQAKLTDDELDKLFSEGKEAKASGAPRTPPEGLSDQAGKVWLNGYHDD
ncbi:MAG: hypothetical protein J0I99_19770 [Devosia sp.]|uniref:hypothetical protein n=1 Tax=Devosia sp. TaxID=1871048 RepID=UPI001ACDFBDC|nr:hypothetical protein [Devosia sp.]MBN9317985.1 hypothetical protein [Devosia sp.]